MTEHQIDIPVLEIGGTHVTAALVDPDSWTVRPGSTSRGPIRAQGTATQVLDDIRAAAEALAITTRRDWAVAIPGPFDYQRGVGLFEHVGKFDSLNGVDVRAALTALIEPAPSRLRFINDADAYGVGEYAAGAGRGYSRLVCITLGTGVGSAFLVEGEPINSGVGVPTDGSIHLLSFAGQPLEATISRRAIRKAFTAESTDLGLAPDVHEIAELARRGHRLAHTVFWNAFSALGSAIADTLSIFAADALVIGGSMSRSWDLIEPALRAGLEQAVPKLARLPLKPADHPDDAPVLGAAYWATHH